MKTLKYTIAIVAVLASAAFSQTPDPSQQGGRFIAANYGQWQAQVQSFNSGVACVQPTTFTLYNNSTFKPWNINSPITIGFETVTPTAFDFLSQPGQVCISALYLQAHFGGDTVKSGTFGLQEALNAAGLRGGGVVTLDANWQGTTAIKNAASIPTNVAIEDVRAGVVGSGTALWTRVGTVAYPRVDIAVDQQAMEEVSVIYDTSGNCPIFGAGYSTGCWRMWFHCGWSTQNICLAESSDAFTWQRSGSAVGGLTANFYSTPVVWKFGGTYYFMGQRGDNFNLDMWTSSDGFNWSSPSSNLILKGTAGTWDSTSLNNPSVVTSGPVSGTWYMAYEGIGTGCSKSCIGTATSTNSGSSWTKGASNPVITAGSTGLAGFGGPDLHYANGQWYLYMHTGQLPSDIYFSTSADFINWTTPILVFRRQTPDEGVSVGSTQAQIADPYIMEAPCVAFWPNAATPVLYNSSGKCSFMFYEAMQTQTTNLTDAHIKLAVSNMPLAQTLAAQTASAASLSVIPGAQPFIQQAYDAPTGGVQGKLFGISPDYWMTRTNVNTDTTGELAFSAVTTATYTWLGKYGIHPECQITPQFDLGATPPRYWVTYTGVTSFTINFSSAVTGSVSYYCYGRN